MRFVSTMCPSTEDALSAAADVANITAANQATGCLIGQSESFDLSICLYHLEASDAADKEASIMMALYSKS